MDIRLVELNNKSRKGTYVYVKCQGKPPRHYLYDGRTPLDAYKQYYEDRYIKKKSLGSFHQYKQAYTDLSENRKPQKRTRVHRQTEQYKRKIKRLPTIQEAIVKGITKVIIKDVRNADNNTINNAKRELLQPLVLDKQLLEMLATDENFKKLKHRLEYRIELKDKNGNTLANNGVFNKTIVDVIRKLQRIVPLDIEIKKGRTPEIARLMEEAGYNKLNILKDGLVKRVQLTIIFRKGK